MILAKTKKRNGIIFSSLKKRILGRLEQMDKAIKVMNTKDDIYSKNKALTEIRYAIESFDISADDINNILSNYISDDRETQ